MNLELMRIIFGFLWGFFLTFTVIVAVLGFLGFFLATTLLVGCAVAFLGISIVLAALYLKPG